jgi:hypothetical protein
MPNYGHPTRQAIESFLAGKEGKGTSVRSRQTAGGLALFSYEEPIAVRVGDNSLDVELDWKYSRTTESHRKFLLTLAEGFQLNKISREEIRKRIGLNPIAPPPRIY